jgi:non-specific serine/threonine protein kinase/serine/threonine-protein kinase
MSSPEQEKNQPASPAGTTRPETGETSEGATIGPYRLLERIGQGGMGEVWLAEQTQPVRRRVAIKLIKAGMDTREVVARFASERQALALMDHPAIAKVFDAGSTPQGRLYFVMEYVEGVPITDYCDQHQLTVSQRLELFLRVCEGVQHAHQKAILHRDLKPSNILVGELDGKPMPRIIDFGVAKAITQRLEDDTVTTLTRAGSVVGTPAYMSPEQADSAGQDVDTRTDVYSLGVVLYELLVGALPFDFTKVPLDQIPRKLREEDAPSPSTKLRSLNVLSSTTAQKRRTDPPTLVRQLRGDLDAITLKALEKGRPRRYASPADFAADIGRYLRQEAVIARPASAVHRARKYVQRHRIGAAGSAVVALLVISFVVAQAVQLRRITHERDRANRERARADRITTFMTDMFKVSDPSEARGNNITAREILDKASSNVDTGLSRDPELQARMMTIMGNVYQSLGLYSRAQSLFGHSVDVLRHTLGAEHPNTLQGIDNLANVYYLQGHYSEAEKLYRQAVESQRRLLGPENLDTLKSMNNLANVLDDEGHYTDAEKLYRETIDIARRVLGPDHVDTLLPMSNLAIVLYDEGRYSEAESLLKQTLETKRRVLGPEHPDTLQVMGNLASVYFAEGRYAEAEKLHRETVEIKRRIMGPEHMETLRSMGNLAATLMQEGRYPDAEKLQRETLSIEGRALGPEHPETLRSMGTLSSLLALESRYAEAEKLQQEALVIQRRVLGPEHPDTALSTYNLGVFAMGEGKRERALGYLAEAVDHGLAPNYDLDIDKDSSFKALHSDPRFYGPRRARQGARRGSPRKIVPRNRLQVYLELELNLRFW